MSRLNYSREDYDYMASERRRALVMIAQKLGKEHPVTQAMGSMAWGRNEREQGPEGNLRTAIEEKAFLDGCFHMLRRFAKSDDLKARKAFELFPRNWASRP